ncbi:MAG TPA: hydrogenase maturation nickel metallochaperone HypA [Jatrophihabitantaceae bacterium]|jgi:hydrogenase nickel incorporation protein HypA/HybF
MHELAIAESIVEAISARTDGAEVRGVLLEIGRLSGVSTDSLRFCFELAVEGTTLAGARLDIREPSGRAHCANCQQEFALDDLIMLCECGSAEVEVLAGNELRIVSVEVCR